MYRMAVTAVLPYFKVFELSRGATNEVARYSAVAKCAGDPYRRCTAWGKGTGVGCVARMMTMSGNLEYGGGI